MSSWSQDAPSQMAIPPFDCAPVLATLDPTTRSPVNIQGEDIVVRETAVTNRKQVSNISVYSI